MASRKRTPETSRITRGSTVAYARKQKANGEPDEAKAEAKPDASTDAKTEAPSGAPHASAGPKAASTDELPVTATSSRSDADLDAPDAGPATARAATLSMPAQAVIGTPPEVPSATSAEHPTRMPNPRDIPEGNPDDPAQPPGSVPPGDSRSLRRDRAFALVYRVGTFVISRFGVVGTRGQWRVVEYPTSASASHAYAKECSRFVAEGFSDYRA